MTTFYICRHGQTENNKNKRLSGWIDTPLTDEGYQNTTTTAAKLAGLSFDKIISSDLGRALITAYLVAKKLDLPLEIEPNKGLREVNYGDLANMGLAAYPVMSATENATFVPPNGESLAQMQERVMACLATMTAKHLNRTILLVAHDGTINSVRASFRDENIGVVDAKQLNPHDFVGKFVHDGDKVVSFEEISGKEQLHADRG